MEELQYEKLIRDLLEDTGYVLIIYDDELVTERPDNFYGGERFIRVNDEELYDVCEFCLVEGNEIVLSDNMTTLKEAVKKLNKFTKERLNESGA